jgi:hypothetical protein
MDELIERLSMMRPRKHFRHVLHRNSAAPFEDRPSVFLLLGPRSHQYASSVPTLRHRKQFLSLQDSLDRFLKALPHTPEDEERISGPILLKKAQEKLRDDLVRA